jgi:hypothetical protein
MRADSGCVRVVSAPTSWSWAKRLLQVDNKRVVRVLVGSTWFDAEQGTYSTKKSENEAGFSFTDPHSGRVVSGRVASVTAVKYEPKKQ